MKYIIHYDVAAERSGAQKKNVMQSMTRISQQVRQGVLEYATKERMTEVMGFWRTIKLDSLQYQPSIQIMF